MKIVRASELPVDTSDTGVQALRLVNRDRGARTMTAGVATFEPGAAIPLHTHPCEETVVILKGRAVAQIEDRTFHLSTHDATIVPPRTPHCFRNETREPMTIAYFYPDVDVSRDPVEDDSARQF